MAVTISDDLLRSTRLTEAEFKRELAVFLFREERLTLAQAARLAEMTRLQFQHLLASREIPVHYSLEDFEEDMRAVREFRPST